MTDQCVVHAVEAAADLGYLVTLVEGAALGLQSILVFHCFEAYEGQLDQLVFQKVVRPGPRTTVSCPTSQVQTIDCTIHWFEAYES